MALYEERLSRDLSRIRGEVAALGMAVEKALHDAVQSSLTGDRPLANRTILGDHPINRKTREISRLSYAFMAVHQPSAGHLRQVASILRLVNELERIGDYAVTIAREAIQLPHPPSGHLREEMEQIAGQAKSCLERAIVAYNDQNAELARETIALASQLKGRGDIIFKELVQESENRSESVPYLLDMLITTGRLKRVGDRAKNICEEALFTFSGESKAPKVYKVLFLDPANNGYSQIAEAVARRSFPHSGEYSSAGRSDKEELKPGLFEFMESQGLVLGPLKPKAIEPDVEKASTYDVIVSLGGPLGDYLPGQPFRTAFLEWDIDEAVGGAAGGAEDFMGAYREITARVRDLMETLRGEEAD